MSVDTVQVYVCNLNNKVLIKSYSKCKFGFDYFR